MNQRWNGALAIGLWCILHMPAAGKIGHEFPGALPAADGAVAAYNLTLAGRIQLAPDSSYTTGDRPQLTDLYVSGRHAFVGSFLQRIYIVDIANPHQMRLVAEIPTSQPAVDIKIEGRVAVIGLQDTRTGGGALLILDISVPEKPHILAQMDMLAQGGVHNLFIHRQRVYIAHSTFKTAGKGLTIVDISDPERPHISGRWRNEALFSDVIHDVFIWDNKAYLSDIMPEQGGLVIVDLQDPDRPQTLASLAIPEGVHSAWQAGGYVYCNQEFGGWEQPLYVIDAKDPTRPEIVRTFRPQITPDRPIMGPHNPYVHNGLLYWGYYDAGLRVFDIRRPDLPVEVAYHTAPVAWGAQPHSDGYIYVSDSGSGGLMAFRLELDAGDPITVVEAADTAADGLYLEQNAPNPFNGETVIGYRLDRGAAVELTIYNLAGQALATLVNQWQGAGVYQAHWDGRDYRGHPVASGVYLYALQAGRQTRSRRISLIR